MTPILTPIQFMLIAAFGSIIQEVIHLYDIRSTLHLPDTTSILKSWKYWAVTVTMIVVSGVGTWLLYGDNLNIKSVIVLLGAAFPLLFKKGVASIGEKTPVLKNEPHLGGFSFKDYFI
jgi:hypothetical protein